jgi:predicted transposase/invertase (TIGR01784 family)
VDDVTYAIGRAFDEAVRRGRREGKLEGKFEAAKAMIGDGLPLETAAKYSGMPVDELRKRLEDGAAVPPSL